jgi:hypothetical protein
MGEPSKLDLDALLRAHKKVLERPIFDGRWIIVVPETCEAQARAAADRHGIPQDWIHVSMVCPPDKCYIIDESKLDELGDDA